MRVRYARVALAVVVALVAAGLPAHQGESEPEAGAQEIAPEAERELVELRTRTSKTFSTAAPGVFRTEVHRSTLHVARGADWVDVDTGLEDQGAELVAKATEVPVRVSKDSGSGELASVEFAPGQRVGFALAWATDRSEKGAARGGPEILALRSPVGAVVEGDVARFEDLVSGVDVELQAVAEGVKETLVLGAAPGPDSFVFDLQLEGVKARVIEGRSVEFVDSAGVVVGRIPPGWMEDSSDLGAESHEVTYELTAMDGRDLLVVRLDRAWLDDPARVYPVRVDPSLISVASDGSGAYDDTFIKSTGTTNHANGSRLWVGFDGVNQNRSFVHFDLSSLAGKKIFHSTLNLYQDFTPTCTPTGLEAYRVTEAWPTPLVSWPGPATSELVGSASTAAGRAGCAASWVNLSVTDATQRWANGSWANHGLSLRAANEADPANRKAFRSAESSQDPYLQIQWSEPTADQYVYDELGRLAAAIDLGGDAAVYAYDAIGNIQSVVRYSVYDHSIIHVGPSSARQGDTVTVYGTGFSATPAQNNVTFNGTPATVTAASATRLEVTVPPAASGTVEVATGAETSQAPRPFSQITPPQITNVSPGWGKTGTTVTITGSGFDPDPKRNAVRFGQMYATVTAATPTQLTVTVPPGSPSGAVRIDTDHGTDIGPDFVWLNAADPAAVTAGRVTFGQQFNPAPDTWAAGIFDAERGQEYAVKLQGVSSEGANISLYGYVGDTALKFSTGSGPLTMRFTARYSGTYTAEPGLKNRWFKIWKCLDTACVEPVSTKGAPPPGVYTNDPDPTAPDLSVEAELVAEADRTADRVAERAVIAGRTLTADGEPIAGVAISAGTTSTTSREDGSFILRDVAPGRASLTMDGRNVGRDGAHFGFYTYGVDTKAGHATTLHQPFWLPEIRADHAVEVASPTDREIVLSHPGRPGLTVTIPAGTALKDHEYRNVESLVLVPFDVQRPPYPVPEGVPSDVGFTIQSAAEHPTGGVYLDGGLATITYPNGDNRPPGSELGLISYYPDRDWVDYGTAQVTADGSRIVPMNGAGVAHLNGSLSSATWSHDASTTPDKETDDAEDGDPVNLRTGSLRMQRTDLALDGEPAIVINRHYNHFDTRVRAFGRGGIFAYDMFLKAPSGTRTLTLPDSSRVTFTQHGTEWVSTATEGEWFGARQYGNPNNNNRERIERRDGSVWWFSPAGSLAEIVDRNGNTVRVERNEGEHTGSVSTARKVISTSGRWVEIEYWNSCGFNTDQVKCRIKSIRDNLGRTVSYTYDANNRLQTVTDPVGQVTTYTYNAQQRLHTVTDDDGAVWLTNTYNGQGKIHTQTLPGPNPAQLPTYTFTYDTDPQSGLQRTVVTDPHGAVRHALFDTNGHFVSDTTAVGTAAQSTTTYIRDSVTSAIQSLTVTDSEYPTGRETTFEYNPDGVAFDPANVAAIPDDVTVTSVTEHGTGNDYTTSYDYDPYLFDLPRETTLPGNRTWQADYDNRGNLTTETDPLGRVMSYDHDDQGLVTEIQRQSHPPTVTGWDQGLFTGITDADGHGMSRIVDGAGRPLVQIDGAGERTVLFWDDLNRLTSSVDPLGQTTSFGWGLHGLESVTDPALNTWSWTYHPTMGTLLSASDPFGKTSTVAYRADGLVECTTSRAGRSTKTDYDSIGRPQFLRYGISGCGGPFESTIEYAYDGAGRVDQVIDSAAGTISYTYDEFDRPDLTTSIEGTTDENWDPVTGRLASVSISGQSPISYEWNAADDLESITQNGTYDIVWNGDGQLDAISGPYGFGQTFDHGPSGQVNSIGYTLAGSIDYGYDRAGRIDTVSSATGAAGGVDMRFLHQMPQPMGEFSYDRYRMTGWAGASGLTYDDDGNLIGDGGNTLEWNARGELVELGTHAEFGYDPLGRRTSRNQFGTTTRFHHYDDNMIQELDQTGTPTVNYLTAGLDQYLSRNDTTMGTDHQGSTALLFEFGGATLYGYAPFGEVTNFGSSDNTVTYTGREADQTGLHYYRDRYYNPQLGRFISEDPAGLAGGLNPYTYVGNDPINNTDPYGNIAFAGIAAACAAGAAVDIALGWATDHLNGRKYTWQKAGRDGATGCVTGIVGFGIGKAALKFTKAAKGAKNARRACKVPASFAADTEVLMADGTTKPISEVAVGEFVLATDPETGESGPREVIATLPHTDQLLTLQTSSGEIVTTEDHKYWNQTDQAWQESQDLDLGDELLSADGDVVTAEGLDWSTVHTDSAYDLTIDDLHTYYVGVGDDEVLVHNCNHQGWRGTNFTREETFNYHYNKHARPRGISPERYAADARAWADSVSLSQGKAVTLKDGSVGYQFRTPGGGPGGIVDGDKNIISFWYR